MRKEVGKNILLVCSVLIAFFLVYRIWFGGYFLPEGHDYITSGVKKLFAPLQHVFEGDDESDFSHNLSVLLRPEKVIVNRVTERRVFNYGTQAYEQSEGFASFVFGNYKPGNCKVLRRESIDLEA